MTTNMSTTSSLRQVAAAWLLAWHFRIPMPTEAGHAEALERAVDDLRERLTPPPLTASLVTELTGFTDRRVIAEVLEDAARIASVTGVAADQVARVLGQLGGWDLPPAAAGDRLGLYAGDRGLHEAGPVASNDAVTLTRGTSSPAPAGERE